MIIEHINEPANLRLIERKHLPQLCTELRNQIITVVARNGGHLASSLGCVELTVALHYVFNTPSDKIIWDVGHQTYAHKLLTGRKDRFYTLRQYQGLSGFPKREESIHDAFNTGHSSTSISAGLGLAVARDLHQETYRVIVVIGDGGMTGGLAFEGLNNAGHLDSDILVILNDNEMFISRRIGALAGYLARLLTLGLVKKIEKRIERLFLRLRYVGTILLRVAKRFKLLLFPGMLFEEMGFTYIGPINGHDIGLLISTLDRLKSFRGPVLLHILTKKGKGYPPAEREPIKFHSCGSFNQETGALVKSSSLPTYSEIFGKTLIRLAEQDKRICAVTAAMTDGTGLREFSEKFPTRFFDVGIAEQHAITFAAGLAAGGLRPVCAIYSTFLQRTVDQLIHDVALPNLPVIIVVDRAGFVGEDGPTHHGIFDLTYLRMIPNLIVMSPRDETELQIMLTTAVSLTQPVAIRYPRGQVQGNVQNAELKYLSVGKGEILLQGEKVALLGIGNMVTTCLQSAELLKQENINVTVADLRYVKPLDTELIYNIASTHRLIFTVEENVLTGGVGEGIRSLLYDKNVTVINLGVPDKFPEQGDINLLRNLYGLSPDAIKETVKRQLR